MLAVESSAGCGCKNISLYKMRLRAADASAPSFQALDSWLDMNAMSGEFVGTGSFLILSATQLERFGDWLVMRDSINTNAFQPPDSSPETLS